MITKFEINEKQEAQIKEWQDAVNKVYEEYGSFDFTFSPNGIGVGLKVYSHVAKVEKDFTDMDSW
jgi:hypothetical protein